MLPVIKAFENDATDMYAGDVIAEAERLPADEASHARIFRALAGGHGAHAGGAQALGDVVWQGRVQASGQPAGHGVMGGQGVGGVFHGWIPLVLRALTKATMAREQCVFTLPSVQPMAAAVSATSSSSQ